MRNRTLIGLLILSAIICVAAGPFSPQIPSLTRGPNDFASFTGKTTPANGDVFLIEDSAASGIKKSLTWANLVAGIGGSLPSGGSVGQSLINTGSGTGSWQSLTVSQLPPGTAGYLLTGNGTGSAPSYQAAPVSLPTQTGSSGDFLTTNGSSASWAQVPLSTGVAGTLPLANLTPGTVANEPLLSGGTGSSPGYANYTFSGSSGSAYNLDNFVTTGGTQTLTNKTLTSPTLTTPALGTPASGNLTNCTGLQPLPINQYQLTGGTAMSAPAIGTAGAEWRYHIGTNGSGTNTGITAATTIPAPSGTTVDGQVGYITILSDSGSHSLTWNGAYLAGTTLSLPATTVASQELAYGFRYDLVRGGWLLLAGAGGF